MFYNNIKKFFLRITNFNLTVLDQVLVSGSNFLISILILRFLGINDFGVFSFYWLILTLINGAQISFVISPMFTNAPKQNKLNIDFFYGGVFFQQIIFTSIVFFFLFCSLNFLELIILIINFKVIIFSFH